MSTINDLISELAGIPYALDQEAYEPWRKPRPRRGTGILDTERVQSDPVFESDGLDVTDRGLWEEQRDATLRALEGGGGGGQSGKSLCGIEALAWYVSFHNNQRSWGIYIPLSSLVLLDELYLSDLPMERDRRFQLAWSALLLHEQMHFALDHACTWFELMLRAPIRREFMARFNSQFPFEWIPVTEAYLEIEETAANAHMLRQLGRTQPREIVRTIEQFVEKQPPAYRNGLGATSDERFAEVVADTLRSYCALWAIEHRLDLGNSAMNLSRLLPIGDDVTLAECPIYAINDLQEIGVTPASLRLIHCISEVIETKKFEKQLQRQDEAVRSDWSEMKEQIKVHLPPPPRFEKLKNWKPPTWSLRLCDGHRVHLQPSESGAQAWYAIAIGNHKEMGHG